MDELRVENNQLYFQEKANANEKDSKKSSGTDILPIVSDNVKDVDKGLKIQHVVSGFLNGIRADGVIDSFHQSPVTGDCYLLSSLSALSSIESGAAILKDNMKKNANGSYTITLPGAKIIAKEYAENGKKNYITGSYTISAAEFNRAKRSGKYATGDDDVILYELAFEKYRKEVMKTNKANGISGDRIVGAQIGSFQGGATQNSPLKGGYGADAMFVLTGKRASACYSNADLVDAVPVNQIKSLDKEKSTILEGRISDKNVNLYLNRIMREPERYAVTIAFKLDMGQGKNGYHAFQLKRVTEDSVILINPWNSSKEIVMSREQFLKSQYSFEVWDSKESGAMQNAADNFSDFWYNLKHVFD